MTMPGILDSLHLPEVWDRVRPAAAIFGIVFVALFAVFRRPRRPRRRSRLP